MAFSICVALSSHAAMCVPYQMLPLLSYWQEEELPVTSSCSHLQLDETWVCCLIFPKSEVCQQWWERYQMRKEGVKTVTDVVGSSRCHVENWDTLNKHFLQTFSYWCNLVMGCEMWAYERESLSFEMFQTDGSLWLKTTYVELQASGIHSLMILF